jgi:hypothetical protein
VIGQPIKQLSGRRAKNRMGHTGIDLRQRHQNEAPLVHSWMWYCQIDAVTASINLVMIEQ